MLVADPPAEPRGSSLGPQLPQGWACCSAHLHHPRMWPLTLLRAGSKGPGCAQDGCAGCWALRGGSARTPSAPRLRAGAKRAVTPPGPWPWGLLLAGAAGGLLGGCWSSCPALQAGMGRGERCLPARTDGNASKGEFCGSGGTCSRVTEYCSNRSADKRNE